MANMNNQGKSPKQYKDSVRFTWYGFLGALLIAICLTLCGCSVTKTTTHNCELMEQGQKCLPDHSCCKK